MLYVMYSSMYTYNNIIAIFLALLGLNLATLQLVVGNVKLATQIPYPQEQQLLLIVLLQQQQQWYRHIYMKFTGLRYVPSAISLQVRSLFLPHFFFFFVTHMTDLCFSVLRLCCTTQ